MARRILAVGSVLGVCLSLNAAGVSAATPSTEIIISIEEDGTPAFDNGAPDPGSGGAGLDAGPNNGILRTYDIARVRMDWNVNDAPGSNVLISSTLPAGMFWESLPSVCVPTGVNPPSQISGRDLTCNIGAQPEGENGSVEAVARLGGVLNNQEFSWNASVTTDESSVIQSNDLSVISSASPKVDLIKDHPAAGQTQEIFNPGVGEVGRVFLFPITVEVGGSGKGSEPLNGDPLQITDDLSAMPASAQLVDFALPGPYATTEICGPNNQLLAGVPFGEIGVTTTATELNSSANSGSWSCSQSGTDIDITITGADTAPETVPSKDSAFGQPLGVNRAVLVSGVVGVWISETDLLMGNPPPPPTVAGSVTNSVDWAVAPVGISGGANTGENPANNSKDAGYTIESIGIWDSFYTNTPGVAKADFGRGTFEILQPDQVGSLAPGYFPYVPTQTQDDNVGDGTVVPGQKFGALMVIENETPGPQSAGVCLQLSGPQTVAPIGDTLLIDALPIGSLAGFISGLTADLSTIPSDGSLFMGNSNFVFGSVEPFPGFVIPLFEHSPFVDDGHLAVEYSTDVHSHDGQCSDSNYSWSATPPTDLTTITQVRYWTSSPMEPTTELRVHTGLEALPGPLGTYFPITTSYKTWSSGNTTIPTGNDWNANPGYDPNNPPMGNQFHDRLQIGGPFLQFDKQITSEQKAALKAGQTVSYELSGTVVGEPSGEVENLVVTDTIPAGLSYAGNASIAPTNGAGAGDSFLEWDFGTVPNGTEFSITYDVTVDPGYAPFSNLVNTADINADYNDGNGLVPLQSFQLNALVQTGGVFSEAEILKSTSTPLIPEDGTMSFDLQYANTGVDNLGDVDLIEVLPFNGDGREPATDFAGTIALSNVDAPNGETVLYSNATPESVVIDPDDPSNVPGGSTQWCTAGEFGDPGCPADMGESTALRFQRAGQFTAGDIFHIGIDVDTQGNLPNDVYTNEFGGRTDGIRLPIRSNDVPVRVEGVDVRIDKELASKGPFRTGEAIPYEITVRNRGPQTATNVEVVDQLPDSLEFISASDNGQHSSGKVEWTISQLDNGESKTLEVTGRATKPGSLTNVALIAGLDQVNRDARSEDSVEVEVLDEQATTTTTTTTPATPTVPPTTPPDGSLPFTGTQSQFLLWGALALITIGGGTILSSRRRQKSGNT